MNKNAWAVILAVTVAVTVFTFGSMWSTRPNSSAGEYAERVFEEAKARQQEPLVSVSEPLKTDIDAMSEEDIMAEKVKTLLASDEEFISNVSDSIYSKVENELNSWGDSYKERLMSEIDKLGNSYIERVDGYIANSDLALHDYVDSTVESAKAYVDELEKNARVYIDENINNLKTSVEKSLSDIENLVDTKAKAAETYIDNGIIEANTYTDTKVTALDEYIATLISDATAYIDSLSKEIDSTIAAKSLEAESYIDKNIADSNTYTDNSLNGIEKYISSIVEEAKSYVDTLVKEVQAYIDSEIENIPYSQTAVEYVPIEIHRELKLLSDSVSAKAYDGYALLEFPSFVSDSDISEGISLFYSEYPSLKDTISFFFNQARVVATYPKGLSVEDINYGLDLVEKLLATFVSIEEPIDTIEKEVPPVDTVEVDPYDFAIHQEIPLFADYITVDAYSDNAKFSFPIFVSDEILNSGLMLLKNEYPNETAVFEFYGTDNGIAVTYDKEYTEQEVESYLDFLIDFYSARIEELMPVEEIKEETVPIEEITPVEVPTEVIVPVEVNPYDFAIHMVIPLFSDYVTVDAYSNSATFALPEFVPDTIIYDGLVMLLSEYPDETSNFDFSVDNKAITVTYDNEYTKQEVESYLDFLIAFYSARIEELIPVEGIKEETEPVGEVTPVEVPTEVIVPVEEVPVEEIEVDEVPVEINPYDFNIHMAIPCFSDYVTVDAYSDRATFAIPAFVPDTVIYDGLAMLISEYPDETSAFDFSVDDKIISVLFDKDYTSEEVEDYLDLLIAFYSSNLDSLISSVIPIEVPTKEIEPIEQVEPIEEVPVEEVSTLYIHREIPLFSSHVIVDAYDGYGTIILPEFVSEAEVLSGIEAINVAFPTETEDFNFSYSGNSVVATYSQGYSKEELNSFIDSVISLISSYISSLSESAEVNAIPTVPMLEVSETNVNEIIVPKAPNIVAERELVISNPQFSMVQEEIADEDIVSARNAIRNTEVESFLNLF